MSDISTLGNIYAPHVEGHLGSKREGGAKVLLKSESIGPNAHESQNRRFYQMDKEKVKGKKERVKVRTAHDVYTGDLFIPERRNRFSDVINKPEMIFINLTDVFVGPGKDRIEHISINKRFIESVRKVD